MPKLSDIQQEERRARLLDAAEHCFARNGFHRTTMQDICREAKVSAGAVYVYFPSKEALIEGFSARERSQVLGAFERVSEAQDFTQALANLMQECIVDKPRHKCTLWLEITAEASRNPALSRMQQECDAQIREAIVAMLQRAQAAGRIAPVLPIGEVATAMEIVAEGMFFRRAVDPDFDIETAGAAAMNMMGSLIRPQGNNILATAPTTGIAIPETV